MLIATVTVFAQWTEPVLVPPPINVNPMGDYYYCSISVDGHVLCLTINPGTFGDDDIYFSEFTDSGWTVPMNAGPNVNTAQRNLSPSITNDRQRLYWVNYDGDYRFYTSTRTGPDWDDWSPGTPLPDPINRGWQFSGQISYDDSTLVFTSRGQPGILHGQDAMYTSHLQVDGNWSEPVLCGFHLNQLNGSIHPCLTDGGQTLVYGMFGGLGRHFDIFYTFRNDTGFGPSIRCDSTIVSNEWDSSPSCPGDGSLLYFESRRPMGSDTFRRALLYVARRVQSAVLEPTARSHVSEAVLQIASDGSGVLHLQLDNVIADSPQTVVVYDILGREAKRAAVSFSRFGNGFRGEIGVDNLPAGSYVITVQLKHQTVNAKYIKVN